MSLPKRETPSDAVPDEPSGDDRPDGAVDWLKGEPPPNPNRRASSLNVRMKVADRERLDRTAKALGVSTSAYARSRLFAAGPDVQAWRRTYQIILSAIEVAEGLGVSDEVADVLHDLQETFEDVAATVFPESAEEG
ncbi:hypothetical protein RQM47_16195 [Rubrivirga sp. S365]|uniref:hypothetical protein n=1 Tax=Rubrivirga sp. S365 TaxID=3076080 RepID=UPI0028C78E17|nr:hypothetical protein [Rubrivirga sp. S365]MDT7858190.1 hypothetical protein [Rubrivirga sp. S365]